MCQTSGRGEIRFKLAVRAAWHLGKDKEDRNKLLKQLKQIYDFIVPKPFIADNLTHQLNLGLDEVSISEFIARARDAMSEINNDRFCTTGDFLIWNSLILGSEEEQISN